MPHTGITDSSATPKARPSELYLLKSGWAPWTVVTKEQWIRAERAAGFRADRGYEDEPATASFSGGDTEGSRVTLEYFDASKYTHDLEMRDTIVAALAALDLEAQS